MIFFHKSCWGQKLDTSCLRATYQDIPRLFLMLGYKRGSPWASQGMHICMHTCINFFSLLYSIFYSVVWDIDLSIRGPLSEPSLARTSFVSTATDIPSPVYFSTYADLAPSSFVFIVMFVIGFLCFFFFVLGVWVVLPIVWVGLDYFAYCLSWFNICCHPKKKPICVDL